uniref:Membrane integral NOTCH2 associated receptor 1 n=1 Tax=Maylandia zebra TaxID=106582 RepID=A0A3P9DK01_9CICH
MDSLPEYSLFLVRILEELDTKHTTMSYQDLCKSLCARFDLVHLAKLRSLLFHTACLDPAFPATLFKDKMRCSTEDPLSKKLMVAADIVTMFNLIHMNGGIAKDKLPIVQRATFHKSQSVEFCRSDSDHLKYQDCDRGIGYEHMDHPREGRHHHHSQQHPVAQNAPPCANSSDCNSRQRFLVSSGPNFLLGMRKDMKCRAGSLDKLHHLPQYSSSSPPSPPCEMQSTYFPMDIDTESTTDQESLQNMGHPEPFSLHTCIQKRNDFKKDFHNFVAFSPQVCGSKAAEGYHNRELRKPATFFNRSFELPYSNPYFEPPLNSPLQDRRRVKHESLDDLQVSTYFGPTTVSECVSSKKHINKAGKQPVWPMKSLSLNAEEGPPVSERIFQSSRPLKENHQCNIITTESEQYFHTPMQKVSASPGFAKKSTEIKPKDISLMGRGPGGLDNGDVAKRFGDKNTKNASFQEGESASSVGTQTERIEQKKLKEYQSKYNDSERHGLKRSVEECEVISDDISDIFRFLDDMSVCDSLGVVQSSCYNSNGSLSQVKSEGDSSPEYRLFHSLENTDDELKTSVCNEISQVLSKLNKLDEKIQEPEANGSTALSPHVYQCNTTGHNVKTDNGYVGEWCCSDGSNSNTLGIKAVKKGMLFRRSSCSLNEEPMATESKVASITNSLQDRGTVSYSCHPEDRDKDRHRKVKEVCRQYELPQVQRLQKQSKDSYLTEQVFSPHHFNPSVKAHMKDSSLYADVRLTSPSAGIRGQPSWTIEEYKRNSGKKEKQLTALDLQTQESLNPNNLEYWMEDIYTPGYDSLLKRKEAEFRRAKACKIGALIAAATCTVILVIVVPICTMKS